MFANAQRRWPVLLPLLLVGLLALLLVPSPGDASGVKEPSTRLIDTSPPETPHQHDDWQAPPSKVPDEFVTAARLLFEQGFADPRGCAYREIEVWSDVGVTRTHGWVLSARLGDEQRYAVCWNGLVYALVSCGNKADLAADVRSVLDRKKEEMPRAIHWRSSGSEARSVAHKTLGDGDDLATALLLRLGEGDLASALWVANHAGPKDEDDRRTQMYLYPSLARQFAGVWFQRLRGAHQRGDDPLALSDARRLSAFTTGAVAEAKAVAPNGEFDPKYYLEFLDLLPALLADQERRACAGPRPAVVCIGPGRHPDAAKRIAALIARLDEADNCDQYGDWANDALVQALIREGEPALEPLLQCYADDRRRTRAIHTGYSRRGSGEYTRYPDVREAARAAIHGILERLQIEPFPAVLLSEDATPRQEAAAIRDYVKTAERLPAAERCFKHLADDAQPDGWRLAAYRLTRPGKTDQPRTALWSRGAFGFRDDRPKPLGELLRGKANPSVTDLLLHRIDQAADPRAVLIAVLAQWEPQAAVEPLARQMIQMRREKQWDAYVRCVTVRSKLGDLKALDEYVLWVATVTPQLERGAHGDLFEPMALYPDHPGMAAAAETLFGNEKSPWLPLAGNPEWQLHQLIATNLLRLPAFRQAVLKELANKDHAGTASAERNGTLSKRRGGGTTTWRREEWQELDIPAEGMSAKFRVCDDIASEIGEHLAGAPRCELYWPQDKRDRAVAACTEYLRHYGDHLFAEPDALKYDRPATAADMRAGKAVFSLTGEGETRMVRDLDWTLPARWTTLHYRPYETEATNPLTGDRVVVKGYRQDGKVVQAEEVLKDGKWRRYYGFVGSNHVAQVPAAEIEFPPPEPGWKERQVWVRLGSGFHARLEVPPLKVELIDGFPARLPADAALTFGLVVRNGRGIEQPAPALDKSVRLRLLYSPETVSRQGALIPQATRDAEWTELKVKKGAAFQGEPGKPLAVVEERKLATFDLRQRFGVSKPGFYRLQLLPAMQEPGALPEVTEVRFSLAR